MNMAVAGWTGDELQVVGSTLDSRNASDAPVSAMAYEPDSDSWRTLPDPPAPLPQAIAGAWDGQRLVVWDCGLTAAAYDPTADEWVPLDDLPLQDGECYPKAVVMAERTVFASYCGQYAVLGEEGWRALRPPESAAPFDASPDGIGVVGSEVFLLMLERGAVFRYTADAASTAEHGLRSLMDWSVLAAEAATSPGVRRVARDAEELAEAWAAAAAVTGPPPVPAGRALLIVSVPSGTCRAANDVLGVEVTTRRVVVVLDEDGEFTRPCSGLADAPRGTISAIAVPDDSLPQDPEVTTRTGAR
jgi:hypothetical protein